MKRTGADFETEFTARPVVTLGGVGSGSENPGQLFQGDLNLGRHRVRDITPTSVEPYGGPSAMGTWVGTDSATIEILEARLTDSVSGGALAGRGLAQAGARLDVGEGAWGIKVNADDIEVDQADLDARYVNSSDPLGDSMRGPLDMRDNYVRGLPGQGSLYAQNDAAPIWMVEALSQGLTPIAPVRVVADTPVVALLGLPVIDGVQLVAGDRVLLVAQTDVRENGPWEVGGVWRRTSDMLVTGTVATVGEGAIHASESWYCTIPAGQAPWEPGVDGSEWAEDVFGYVTQAAMDAAIEQARIDHEADQDPHVQYLQPDEVVTGLGLTATVQPNGEVLITQDNPGRVTAPYAWSDSSVVGDPGAGRVSVDSSPGGSEFILSIAEKDSNGDPHGVLYRLLEVGDRVQINSSTGFAASGAVNSLPVDHGTWLELGVLLLGNAGTAPSDGDPVDVRFDIAGASVSDHGLLAGLGDDDHGIYVLVDGSRDMTGSLGFAADGDGIKFLTGTPGASGGGIRKKYGTGVTISSDSTNLQPGIEDADGSNRRLIIDEVSGDARYLAKSSATMGSTTRGITAGRWYRVASVGLDGAVELTMHAATTDGLNGFGMDATVWLRHTSVGYAQFDIKDVTVHGTQLFDRIGIWSAYWVWVRAAASNPSLKWGVLASRVSDAVSGVGDFTEAPTPGGTAYGEAALTVRGIGMYLPLTGGTLSGKLFANDGLKVGNALEVQDGTTSSCSMPGTWNVPASGTTRTVKINGAGTLMADASTWRIKRGIGGIDGGPAPAAVPVERRSVPQAGAHPAGVLDLTPVVFTDESGHRKAGLIAEDVGDHFPIATSPEMDMVDWNAITAGLLHEVQRLSSRVAALEEGS